MGGELLKSRFFPGCKTCIGDSFVIWKQSEYVTAGSPRLLPWSVGGQGPTSYKEQEGDRSHSRGNLILSTDYP